MEFKSLDHLIKVYEKFRNLKLSEKKRRAYKKKLDRWAERYILEKYNPEDEVESKQVCISSNRWDAILSGQINLCGSNSSI